MVVSALRQQLEHERRLRQQAEGRCVELKLENEKCTVRLHELQRNFEGIQSQLRQMLASQKRVDHVIAEKAALQSRLEEASTRHDSRIKILEEENQRLSNELTLAIGTRADQAAGSQTTQLRALLTKLEEDNKQLREDAVTKQEKYDKAMNEITGEIVSTLNKHEAACNEKRELEAKCETLQAKCDKQQQDILSLERKNQTFLKLLCRVKNKQAALPEFDGEDDHPGTNNTGDRDLAHTNMLLGKGSSLISLESDSSAHRHTGHLPVRSASLRSAIHPLRRVGLRRSASGNVNHQLEDHHAEDDILTSSEYNISNRNDSSSMHSLLSSGSDVRGVGSYQRHRLLQSSHSKPSETAIREQSSGESRPPSLPDLNASPGYHPNRVSKTPDSLLLPQSVLGPRSSALSITSLTKLEGQLSRCTNRSIDSVTAEHLRRMKRDGTLAAQIKKHSNGDTALPATPSPPNRGSLIESESSEEEEDHINFVEMWKKRSADPSRAIKPGTRGRPLSQVDSSTISRQEAAEKEKALNPKTASLPRNASLSTASVNDENARPAVDGGPVAKVLSADASTNRTGSPASKPPEIAASARATLLDSLVTSNTGRPETSPPLSPGRVPSLAEAKDYLKCLRRRNVNNEKPLRGPMTVIQFVEKNYFNRFDKPEQTALQAFDFLDTFQFIEPGADPILGQKAAPVKPRSPKLPSKITDSPKGAPKLAKAAVEKRSSSAVRVRPGTPTRSGASATSSRSPGSSSASEKKPSNITPTKRTTSGTSVSSNSPATSLEKSPRAPSPQVSDKKRPVAAPSNPAVRTKSSSQVTLSKGSPPAKPRASKTTSSPLRAPASGTASAAKSSTSSSSGRRLGALLGHHGTSSSKSSSASASSGSLKGSSSKVKK